MNPELERIEVLFRSFLDGCLSDLERIELQSYLDKYPELKVLYASLNEDDSFLTNERPAFMALDKPLEEARGDDGKRVYFFPKRLVAVLALFFVALLAIWLYKSSVKADLLTRQERYKNDILAGSNKAVITFADGDWLYVGDTLAIGRQQRKGGAEVELSDGQIKYLSLKMEASGRPGYHTIKTPQGGQYLVILPDGSSAKLNAASSIRFPSSFNQQRREVEVRGEVYFDIQSDQKRPFVVSLPNGAKINVLGTSFNVRAYPRERIKTTLDNGSVKLNVGDDELIMKSGEQVELAAEASDPVLLKRKVDLSLETSWKDGYFNFENAELTTIMTEIARWYDVDIHYKNRITEQFNILMLPRSLSVSKLLELLELTGHVRFIIEGRRITVMT